jgi:hypothetical protein
MFRIRKEQLDHFRKAGKARYLERVVEWVDETYPGRFPYRSRAELAETVRQAVAKADAHGFEIELETTQLVLLLLHFGLDADERLAWFGDALNDRGLTAIGKARKLVAEARAHGAQDIDPIDITEPEVVT